MKNLRRISLMISIMALCALSCQTVTRMFTLSSPTPSASAHTGAPHSGAPQAHRHHASRRSAHTA